MSVFIDEVEFLLCLTLTGLLGKNSSLIDVRIAINFLYDSFGSFYYNFLLFPSKFRVI